MRFTPATFESEPNIAKLLRLVCVAFVLVGCDLKSLNYRDSGSGIVVPNLVGQIETPTPTPAPSPTPPPISAKLVGVEADVKTGTAVVCSLESVSTFQGEPFYPTFKFYNAKDKVTPRAEIKVPPSVARAEYNLKPAGSVGATNADSRGDEIYCEVTAETSTVSISTTSNNVTVADSAPTVSVANGSLIQTGLTAGGAFQQIELTGFDADGDALTYVQEYSDCSSVTLNSATGIVSGTLPTNSDAKSDRLCNLVFKVSANGVKSSNEIKATFEIPNHSPSLECDNKTQTVIAGESIAAIDCTAEILISEIRWR